MCISLINGTDKSNEERERGESVCENETKILNRKFGKFMINKMRNSASPSKPGGSRVPGFSGLCVRIIYSQSTVSLESLANNRNQSLSIAQLTDYQSRSGLGNS